jgi:acyl dehydratase
MSYNNLADLSYALSDGRESAVNRPIVYWEDIIEGDLREGGAHAFDADAIKRFAREFDPRPTHLDEAVADASFFKGLAASGAHTFAVWARLYWELTPGWATQAGTHMRDLRLFRPVRPGDVLSLRLTVLSKRPHPLRGQFGFVETKHELFNQAGQPVFHVECSLMIERRPVNA